MDIPYHVAKQSLRSQFNGPSRKKVQSHINIAGKSNRKKSIGNLLTCNISGMTILPFIFNIVKTNLKEK